jgi:hypothetical protein
MRASFVYISSFITGLLLLTSSARAALLVYEPFDYADGWLNGQGGATGTTGTWVSTDTGWVDGWRVHPEGELTGVAVSTNGPPPGELNLFTGTAANLGTSGGFVGMVGPEDRGLPYGTDSGTGNADAHIGLASNVTATFQAGTTTWFSYLAAHAWDKNQGSPVFMIGTDPITPGSRGLSMQNAGNGIGGVGGPPRSNLYDVYPHYFSGGVHHQTPGGYLDDVLGDHNGVVPDFARNGDGVLGPDDVMTWAVTNTAGFGAPNIVVGKIEWDADTNGLDIITVVRFLETDALSEAAFDALVTAQPTLSSKNWPDAVTPADPLNPGNRPDLDQSQFDTLSLSSLKFFIDELRIGTTFGAVTPDSVVSLRGTLFSVQGPTE